LTLLALRTPLPIPAEEGVEVDLGFSDKGTGLIQPDYAGNQQPKPASLTKKQDVEEEIITQRVEEAPSVPEKRKETPKKPVIEKKVVPETKPEPNPIPVEEPQKVDQRAIFKGNGTNSQTGGSEGITGKPGDQGSPDGLKDIKRYDGNGGSGNGPKVSLGGRGSKYLEKPTAEVVERGEVVVEIWVDQNGIVKKAQVSPKGTTIVNAKLRDIAVKAAMKSTFAADQNAAALQRGTITYTFII
jgi:TonB family protein